MHNMKRKVLGIILAMGLSSGALAAMQEISGDHVTFTYDDSLLSLFGTPEVSGDTIFFSPTAFTAKSMDGTGMGFSNATLNIGVKANTGFKLTGVDLTEQGDYWLFAPLGASAMGVGVSGQIRVRDMATLAEMTDGIAATAPMTTVGFSSIDWTAKADASFAAWQSEAVKLTIENLLVAYTTAAPSLAFVEKKYVGAEFSVVAIPEPETFAMFLAGLGMIGMVARRRVNK